MPSFYIRLILFMLAIFFVYYIARANPFIPLLSGGTGTSEGGTGPSGPVVLLGETTDYSSGTTRSLSPNNVYHMVMDAVATGSATKGFVNKYGESGNSALCKMVLANSSGTVLGTSNAITIGGQGLKEFAFSPGVSITSGVSYKIGVFCGGYFYPKSASSGSVSLPYTSGTYPTVPGTISQSGTVGASAPIRMYVTTE